MCEAVLDMMAVSLRFKSPLVSFFFTQRVIHALVVVAYLLFCSIGFCFWPLSLCTDTEHRPRSTDDKDGPDLLRRRAT